MTFLEPWVLAALAALPILWWLLRVTPPAPRTETFPAIRLLLGLLAREETPARTPWWLLLLRLLAAGLVIVALARPVLDAATSITGSGSILLVIDNGWASATEWTRRIEAASGILDRAERSGRAVAVLATAADGTGEPPRILGPFPVPEARSRLSALLPRPWPTDRTAAAAALGGWREGAASVLYVGDGTLVVGEGGVEDGFPAFAAALGRIGPVTQLCCVATPPRAMLTPDSEADRLIARIAQVPSPMPRDVGVLAQAGDGRTLGRATATIPAGDAEVRIPVPLPPELRNRLTRLVIEGPSNAGSVALLDERWRRRPVGLIAGEETATDAPFTGAFYYLKRALGPFAELREGSLEMLLKRDISVLVLVDKPLPPGPDRDRLVAWVEKGGLLIRFAGPRSAEPMGCRDRSVAAGAPAGR